jgi:putative ABC transport system permease protein
MRALRRKVLRDIWVQRRQFGALAITVAAGVVAFMVAFVLHHNLDASYANTYSRLKFEDFEIALRDAPASTVDRVRSVRGVSAAEGRLVRNIVIETQVSPPIRVFGRFVSVPARRRPAVDDLAIDEGRYVERSMARDVMLETSFAQAHHLRPDDVVMADLGRQRIPLRVVGTVYSPEYIYAAQSRQSPTASPDTFGVVFLSHDVLSSILGKPGLVNQIVARVDGTRPLADVMRDVQARLSAYEPENPIPRADQPSFKLLNAILQSLASFSVLFPILFFSVAALADYSLMMRTVATQRSVVGLLRSLGYSPRAVMAHYLASAAVVGFIGSFIGGIAGIWVSIWFMHNWASVMTVPFQTFLSPWPPILIGALSGTTACLLGAAAPARAASRLEPAEALRAPPQAVGRVVKLDRWIVVVRSFPLFWRLPLRNLFRNRRRTSTTMFGVGAAVALIIVANGMRDSITAHVGSFFTDLSAFDVSVRLDAVGDEGSVDRIRNIPGVVWAEPILVIAADLRHGGVVKSILVNGVPVGSRLLNLRSVEGREVNPSGTTMVVTDELEQLLNVSQGGVVMTALPSLTTDGPRRWRSVRVGDAAFLPMGYVGYVTLDEARRLYGADLGLPPGAVSSIAVKVAPGAERLVESRARELPHVAALQSTTDFVREVGAMMGVYFAFLTAMVVVGLALGFSMVYNMVTANVTERESEIATMRSLGIHMRSISGALLTENLCAAAIGLTFGLVAGRYLVNVFIAAANMDLMPLRAVVEPGTLIGAALLVLFVAVVSQVPALQVASRIDLALATRQQAS